MIFKNKIKIFLIICCFLSACLIQEDKSKVYGVRIDLGKMISYEYLSTPCPGCTKGVSEKTIIKTEKMTIVIDDIISLPNSGQAYYIENPNDPCKYFTLEGLDKCYRFW